MHELLRLYAGAREQVIFDHPARADIEALKLIEVATVHVDAAMHFARVDMPASILPAAASSRSAYEARFIAEWLLGPEDPVERDRRWLGYLAGHARFYSNLAGEFKDRHDDIRESMQKLEAYWKEVGQEFAASLPADQNAPIAYAGVSQALAEKKRQYYLYRSVSQLVHSEPTALSFAPAELRLADHPKQEPLQYSLHSEHQQWAYVLGMAGEAFISPLEIAIRRLSTFDPRFAENDWKRFLETIDRLAQS